jgi:hypothetical protein
VPDWCKKTIAMTAAEPKNNVKPIYKWEKSHTFLT